MSKFFAALFAVFLFAVPTEAEDNAASVGNVAPRLLEFPDCNDGRLQRLLDEKIAEYYRKTPPSSLLEKRMQKLILRNFNDFEPVDTSSFTTDDNLRVANKLLTVKINNGLEDNEIRLCRTRGNSKLPAVYLLIYPENYYYMVDVINFVNYSPTHKDFFVIYD